MGEAWFWLNCGYKIQNIAGLTSYEEAFDPGPQVRLTSVLLSDFNISLSHM